MTIPVILLAFNIADATVKIGIILPETGRFADIAIMMRAAFDLALEATDNQDSPPLELIYADNFSNPDSAGAVAGRLVTREGVVALAGGFPSDCCAEVIRVAEEFSVPYLIVSASDDSLTIGSDRHIFRLAPPTTEYNEGLIGWAVAVAGIERRVAVLYDDRSLWGGSVRDLKHDLEVNWSGQVRYYPFSAGERDFIGTIEQMKQRRTGIVWILGGTEDGAMFLRQCREANWAPAAYTAGTVKQVNRRLISASDGAADYVCGPAIWWQSHPYPEVEIFNKLFRERLGELPDYHSAEAYAAMQVLMDAVKRTEYISRSSLRNSLEHTDLITVFGRVRFDDYRMFSRQNRVRTCLVQLQGDRWLTIWPSQLATGNYVYPIPDWGVRQQETKSRTRMNFYVLLMIAITVYLLVTAAKKRQALLKKMNGG